MQKNKVFYITVLLFFLFSFPATLIAQKKKPGLPLPRFASLRANEVNIRTGPGLQYPIDWVYQRRAMPVEIIAEFETWRKVRDWQNTEGWVHQSTLSGKRMFIIINSPQAIRKIGNNQGSVVAEAEPGVVGKLTSCKPTSDWCQVSVEGHRGWLRRTQIWGVYRDEGVD